MAVVREILTDRLSLVVGVTGHRDIASDDEPPLRAAFGKVLDSLERACPHTPLLVLSGLAAGADSLAAEEAIARNIPVFACLPMPVEEYEKDFSPTELARFRTLLGASSRVEVTSPTRENGYVATGRFITKYSHLLVAFWDGVTSRGAGGTADVINMRLLGNTQSADIETIPYLPDIGPVDHIVTPRLNGPRPDQPFTMNRLYPKWFLRDGNVRRTFESLLAHIDCYNLDLIQTQHATADPQLQSLMDRTDGAANRLQKRTNFFQRLLFVVAFGVAAVQIIHAPVSAKFIGLAVAFGAYGLARKYDYENRYQDYRAIAEGLRVQSAWYCAGIGDRLVDREYLRMQEGELQWIRMALRFFYLLYCEGRASPDASYNHPVCRDWVRSQWRYYYSASRREAFIKDVLDRISFVVIVVGAIFTIVSVGVLVSQGLFGRALCEGWPWCAGPLPKLFGSSDNFVLATTLLTVPVAIAVVLGALFSHYAEKQNLNGNARRYNRMFHVFDRARRALRLISDGKAGDPQEVVYEVGRAALAEHADWLIMRRDRPMEVVMA